MADNPGIYTRQITVGRDTLDQNRHVNNLVFVRWMQDVAVEHSVVRGWPLERYLSEDSAWVVRSHFIEYLQPAVEGDGLTALTWVNAMKNSQCTRHYLFWRARDRRPVVTAETLWVYVSVSSGRIKRIPETVRAAFPLVGDAEAKAALHQ